jgi:hypothetical protein
VLRFGACLELGQEFGGRAHGDPSGEDGEVAVAGDQDRPLRRSEGDEVIVSRILRPDRGWTRRVDGELCGAAQPTGEGVGSTGSTSLAKWRELDSVAFHQVISCGSTRAGRRQHESRREVLGHLTDG